MLKRSDIESAPCGCPICHQAGVAERPQLRSPQTGALLHGYDLRRLYEAQEAFWRTFRRLVEQHSMPSTSRSAKPLTTRQRIDAAFARRPAGEDLEPGSDG